MKKIMKKQIILLTVLFAATSVQAAPKSCPIHANGMGGVKIGQTLSQVKRQFPQARFSATRDAEGALFTAIQFNRQTEILAHIDEDTGKIDFLETFSAACKTADGIHPKMPLREVVKRWGSLKQITMSEIEMRQFAEFPRQAKWLTVRVDGGDFSAVGDDLTLPLLTRKFSRHAKVLSLVVAK